MTRILWVDDQTDVAKSIVGLLAVENCHFEFSPNGEDALERIKKSHYDIVLVDLAMPPGRWGGLWLLEQLKEIKNRIISIVVSGEGTQTETIKALRLGATDYVTKDKITLELPLQIIAALEIEPKKKATIISIIKAGESDCVEFKSTFRTNLHTQKKDSDIELSSLKTIMGFLNTNGGDLLIGVSDEGEILGTEADLFQNNDKFQLHFWHKFKEVSDIQSLSLVKCEFIEIDGKSVFHVSCSKSNLPAFLKWKFQGDSKAQEMFYVRVGPQTESLGTRQALSYIESHFSSKH
ncbi:response regulator [Pseudomonas sp. P7548]|uniref:response regulator n=1 Tax=Pseudomonas sp. P7548 TaxID=2726981 RepID=UPI0015BFF69F|nr:response regulator [Pseudomonas sp. P7548]NWE18216.1 response regulator [Pseudomonas sp. P7548]